MNNKYKNIGKILFLTLCIQHAIGIAYAKEIVFDGSNTKGSPLPVNTSPIGETQNNSNYNNLLKNTTVNSDGSITVSGSGNKNSVSDTNISKKIGNTGLTLTPQEKPSVKAFDNRGQSNSGEIVVSGGQAGAQKLQDLRTIRGSAAGVSATIGGGASVNIPSTQTMQPQPAGVQQPQQNSAPDANKVLTFTGGVGNASSEKNNDSGRVLIFKGGQQNNGKYQVINQNNDAKTPTLESFKIKESNAVISDNTNNGSADSPLPVSIQKRINQTIQDMPLPKDLPPLPGTKNGNVMLPISLPTSEAAALPPLPADFIPNLGIQIGTTDQGGINNNGIPVNPNGDPINYTGLSSDVGSPDISGVDKEWTDIMQSEANAFMNMGLPLRIVVVNSENTLLRKFVAQNILRTTKETFDGVDIGLSAVLSTQSTGDNINAPTCYIMFKKDDLSTFKSQFLDPLSAIAGKKATASYLIGHQVAHCMDNLERYKVIPKRNVWFSNDIAHYGIAAPVMRRVYPYGMTYNQYSHTTMHFYQDIGQRQYQERIADIFGLYLTLYRGYDTKIITAVQALRKGLPVNSSHNTGSAISDIYARYSALIKGNVQDLWKGARTLQYEKGIDNSLGDGVSSSIVYDTSSENRQANTNLENAVEKETKEDSKNKSNTKKKMIINDKVSFDNYSGFGHSSKGMGTPFGTSSLK